MKPSIPDVLDRFRAYHAVHPTWGSLHVVLDDGNTQDCFVDGTAERLAREAFDDEEGAQLIAVLRLMSRTQRRKLARILP